MSGCGNAARTCDRDKILAVLEDKRGRSRASVSGCMVSSFMGTSFCVKFRNRLWLGVEVFILEQS